MVCFILRRVHLCSSVLLPSLPCLRSAHQAASITSRTLGVTNCCCVSILFCGGKAVTTILRSWSEWKVLFLLPSLCFILLAGFDGSFEMMEDVSEGPSCSARRLETVSQSVYLGVVNENVKCMDCQLSVPPGFVFILFYNFCLLSWT